MVVIYLSGTYREFDNKSGSLRLVVLNFYVTFMILYNGIHYSKTKACPMFFC